MKELRDVLMLYLFSPEPRLKLRGDIEAALDAAEERIDALETRVEELAGMVEAKPLGEVPSE